MFSKTFFIGIKIAIIPYKSNITPNYRYLLSNLNRKSQIGLSSFGFNIDFSRNVHTTSIELEDFGEKNDQVAVLNDSFYQQQFNRLDYYQIHKARRSKSAGMYLLNSLPERDILLDQEAVNIVAKSRGPGWGDEGLAKYMESSQVKAAILDSIRYYYHIHGDSFFDQLKLETQAVNREMLKTQSTISNLNEMGKGVEQVFMQTMLSSWYKSLVVDLKKAIENNKKSERKLAKMSEADRRIQSDMQTILEYVPAGQLAVLTLYTVVGNLLKEHKGVSNRKLSILVAEDVCAHFNLQYINKIASDFHSFADTGKRNTKSSVKRIFSNFNHLRETFQKELGISPDCAQSENPSENNIPSFQQVVKYTPPAEGSRVEKLARSVSLPPWSARLKEEVGSFLTKVLHNSAYFRPNAHSAAGLHEQKAFEIIHNSEKQVLRLSPHILEHINLEQALSEMTHVRQYPMVIKPKPWLEPEDGGYFLYPDVLLRYYDYSAQMKPLYDCNDHLKELYKALDILGSTEWIINKDVFAVVREAWDSGGGIAELPPRQDIPIPIPGIEGKTKAWYKKVAKIERDNANMHSLRCDFLLKLQVSEKFANRSMYFPHNMDFRGRVYPIPPHLNHMGSDLSRGLLTFAEGRPLGERGLYWLKVQLAGLYGNDKISFEGRVRWAEENIDEIFDSVENPLNGNKFWLKAEDPFQFLATSFEIVKALKNPGGPEKFVSHLPIHMDGTCNGLQHYAALGGDEHGARSVNLAPTDEPQDVYSEVVALVNKCIDADVANGIEIAQKLKGKVTRQIIKQTVMTSVYGVTFVGAREQIGNALREKGVLTEDDRYKASLYLSAATFSSIGEMFSGARHIMDWFSTCASLVAKRNRLVKWVTPLGLPVVQTYRTIDKKKTIKTTFHSFSLENEENQKVSSRKQASAFPPNYVHSLDSTHMLLTALACNKKGIIFSSVHDSYWCHAQHVDQMNVILRECFANLHGKPLLQRLRDQFIYDNPDIDFPPVPTKGNFDLEMVKKSTYFFN